MTAFASLLAPLDGSRAAAASLGCAAWLAARLDAKLHVLSATTTPLPAREELARLHVPPEYWTRIILHQAPEFPEQAILAATLEHDADIVVMSAAGETAEKTGARRPDAFGIVGHVARAVIEQSRAPVLLAPPAYRENLPWRNLLAPLSGEPETDHALTLAVMLANALDLQVHIAHVIGSDAYRSGLAAAAHYADAPHHEYPQQFAELVRRNMPYLTDEECRCIAGVALVQGDIAHALLNLITEKHIDLIVVGWHGRFGTGHAGVLKDLLPLITCPVLLVKPAQGPAFRLKVGENIE
ncbi:MAG: hypothetical protein BroJett013_25380 [Alphaproteobacteria bacterium]|nr:MAG: hypothetical protein BroJett013_25380 [Alphaproteobacteria bacterium]